VGITVLGAAAVAMSLLEVFQQTHWRATRAGLYVGLGLMGVVPLAHMLVLHGDVWHVRTFVLRDIVMGLCYVVSTTRRHT
jgi:adiponectin receptor